MAGDHPRQRLRETRPRRCVMDLDCKAIRESLKLSQSQFAALLDISVRTIHKWESPTGTAPSGAARSLLKIAKDRPDVLKDVLG